MLSLSDKRLIACYLVKAAKHSNPFALPLIAGSVLAWLDNERREAAILDWATDPDRPSLADHPALRRIPRKQTAANWSAGLDAHLKKREP